MRIHAATSVVFVARAEQWFEDFAFGILNVAVFVGEIGFATDK